tara:strand:+ start:1911 stop:2099 length:189 start_codon:yes stop_codon:yes gene_type:complete
MKKYEVEFKSTTYRTYVVDAVSEKQAERFAYKVLDEDFEVGYAWKENAEVSIITVESDKEQE